MKSLSEEESKLGLVSTSKFMSKKPILDFRIAKIRFDDNGERVERGGKLSLGLGDLNLRLGTWVFIVCLASVDAYVIWICICSYCSHRSLCCNAC